MDEPLPATEANAWARQVAAVMVTAFPELAVDSMSKAKRQGRVLIDWSQNNPAKTTVAPYSLRGRSEPTAAAPRTWDELADPELQHLHYREVLDRLAAGIDPLADLHAGPQLEQRKVAVGGAPRRPARAGGATTAPRRPAAARPLVVVRRATPTRPTVAAADVAAGKSRLPADLSGPVAVTLAKAAEQLPAPAAMAGGTRYELKWDGYRATPLTNSCVVSRSKRLRKTLTTAPARSLNAPALTGSSQLRV